MRVLPRVFLILVALSAALAISPVYAGWQPGGARISAHTPNDENVRIIGMVSDGSQGAIVSWEWNKYLNMDYSDYRTMAQHVNASGNIPAPWPAGGVTVRTWYSDPGATIYIFSSATVPDGAGGVWCPEDFQQFQVEYLGMLHLYRAAANGAVTGLPNYSGTGVLSGPHVNAFAVDADGSGGVVYMALERTYGGCCTPRYGAVYAQRVDSQGNNLWSPAPYFTRSDSLLGQPDDPQQFDVLTDGAGGAFFAWGEIGSNGLPNLYVQHVLASGAIAPGWPAQGALVRSGAGAINRVVLAPNGAGGVFVVWVDLRAGAGQTHLYAHNVLADGSLAPGIPANGRPVPSVHLQDDFDAVVSDEQGGLFLVRKSRDNGTNHQVRLHRLESALQPRSGWPADGMLLSNVFYGYDDVGLVADGDGGAFLAFTARGPGTGYPDGLIGQHLASDGTPAPGWTSAGYLLSPSQYFGAPRMVRSGTGTIVAWSESNYYRPGEGGVYAQRLVPDGPVAVQVSLVEAKVAPGEATLHWYVSGAAALSATVERRTGNAVWTSLGSASPDGQGHLRYVDRTVSSGRFDYRLSWVEEGTVRYGGETSVEIPDAWKLALSSANANPGSGPAAFTIVLPTRAPGSIELLDLQGRRVAHRDLGSLEAGAYRVTIDEASSLAPGVYLARLTHGGQSRTTRISRIR